VHDLSETASGPLAEKTITRLSGYARGSRRRNLRKETTPTISARQPTMSIQATYEDVGYVHNVAGP